MISGGQTFPHKKGYIWKRANPSGPAVCPRRTLALLIHLELVEILHFELNEVEDSNCRYLIQTWPNVDFESGYYLANKKERPVSGTYGYKAQYIIAFSAVKKKKRSI